MYISNWYCSVDMTFEWICSTNKISNLQSNPVKLLLAGVHGNRFLLNLSTSRQGQRAPAKCLRKRFKYLIRKTYNRWGWTESIGEGKIVYINWNAMQNISDIYSMFDAYKKDSNMCICGLCDIWQHMNSLYVEE